jgi:integral membrane sensor domain MASE1
MANGTKGYIFEKGASMGGELIPVWIPKQMAELLLPRLEEGKPPAPADCISLASMITAALTGQNQPPQEPNNPT